MRQVIPATYQDGILKLSQKLPLSDQQQVLIIVLPLPQVDSSDEFQPERVAAMQEQARNWLSQQPSTAVRPPLRLTPARKQDLEDSFETALADIRARAGLFSAEEVLADIEAALDEARTLPADVRDRLDAELDAALAEWATDAL
jgi:predicted DNA-binding antitoxin AbrB/MazE fold protein